MADAGCGFGPEGGPRIVDRGIGGTGSPLQVHAAAQIADRAIGDTGIVGVITGFGSVCVNGLEVGYDDAVAVDIDGADAAAATLRVGQVVVIQAEGPLSAPFARKISIRNELSGRIEAMDPGSGTLTVAGQSVLVPAGTRDADRFVTGDWVAVSGLRRQDGLLVASLVQAAAPNRFSAHGLVVRQSSVTRVGSLVVPETLAIGVKVGQSVTVSGSDVDGKMQVDAVARDGLFADPARYFGRSVSRLVVHAFVHAENGRIWLNGESFAGSRRETPTTRSSGVAVVTLQRQPNGAFVAVGLRFVE